MNLQFQANKKLELSIVIPAHNEEYRLANTVITTSKWCHENKLDAEILIVECASTDNTMAIVKELSANIDIVRGMCCRKLGKGNAVKKGMLNSAGQNIMFMDADGAAPPTEIKKLLSCRDRGWDIVVGSRIPARNNQSSVVRSQPRIFLSQVLNLIISPLLPTNLSDAMCGFKLFRQEVVSDVFGRQKIGGWAFDIEVLYIAKQLEMSVGEVQISWTQKEGSKVDIILDPIRILFDALRIKSMHRLETWQRQHKAPKDQNCT